MRQRCLLVLVAPALVLLWVGVLESCGRADGALGLRGGAAPRAAAPARFGALDAAAHGGGGAPLEAVAGFLDGALARMAAAPGEDPFRILGAALEARGAQVGARPAAAGRGHEAAAAAAEAEPPAAGEAARAGAFRAPVRGRCVDASGTEVRHMWRSKQNATTCAEECARRPECLAHALKGHICNLYGAEIEKGGKKGWAFGGGKMYGRQAYTVPVTGSTRVEGDAGGFQCWVRAGAPGAGG